MQKNEIKNINNQDNNEISKQVENSLELLILYRSIYIIKQKFSLFKERIKNIYQQYNIYKDNISRGYFEILESYESVTEAIKNMKLGHNILIRENCYYLGIVRNTINECSEAGTIINLYSNRFVKMREGAVRMCDLDDIHTPKQMMTLYERVAESVPELKSILEGIEVPEFNPDLDCRRWIEDTWNKVHESLDIPEENKIIENISYTNFSI